MANRFLLCKSGWDVQILWLDAHGSCTHYDGEGSLYFTRWHPYRDSDGKLQTRLCPNGLEQNEWPRVFTDDPPGSWVAAYSDYKTAPPKRNSWEDSDGRS